jgi:hypothetical protein
MAALWPIWALVAMGWFGSVVPVLGSTVLGSPVVPTGVLRLWEREVHKVGLQE